MSLRTSEFESCLLVRLGKRARRRALRTLGQEISVILAVQ
jgi:hypothetical protein